jgi:hypothetical protein
MKPVDYAKYAQQFGISNSIASNFTNLQTEIVTNVTDTTAQTAALTNLHQAFQWLVSGMVTTGKLRAVS